MASSLARSTLAVARFARTSNSAFGVVSALSSSCTGRGPILASTQRLVATLPVRRFLSTESKPEEQAADAAAVAAPTEDPFAAKLKELQEELAEMKNDRLRMLAEMENVRMIARRDVDTAKTYAIQSFAKDLLQVSDTLAMAIDSVPAEELQKEDAKTLRLLHEGVSMTRHSLLKLFGHNGMKEFGAVGEKFDANKHEVMFEMHHDDIDHGHVAQVIKSGFLLKDRVLRPAKVGTVRKTAK